LEELQGWRGRKAKLGAVYVKNSSMINWYQTIDLNGMGNKTYATVVGKGRTRNMIKENGQIVKCPHCGSTKVERVHPFDYWKFCRSCKKNFMTGEHN